MENLSKMTIDDSSTSMYFSFNSTTANKTVEAMESGAEISYMLDDESEQNNTLEADKKIEAPEQQTVKKLSFDVSPMKAIPKNILKAYKAISSTPTKAQLLRSVEVTRGSAAIDVCDLGLAFLEAPQECINAILSDDKENQPQESQEIYSETSSEIVVSVIEKTQDEEKPIGKKVGFSNLPVFKGSNDGNRNMRCTPKVRRSMPRCEPDLATNRPSRIASKRMSIMTKDANDAAKELMSDEIPKMINSILKISKGLPPKRKSFGNSEKPLNLLGRTTRMSILKTTLNSPAKKNSRKSIALTQVGRNPLRQSVAPVNNRKSIAADNAAAPRRNDKPMNTRKSMLPTTTTSPKKRINAMNTRKSMIPQNPKTSSIPTSQKIAAQKPSTSAAEAIKLKKPPTGVKDDYICEVCSKKFRVPYLLEAHKISHNANKQTFSGNDKQCRYCDKKFAIAKALSNHLIQNCTKIPPGDKKKLLYPTTQPLQTAAQPNTKMPPKSCSNLSSCDSLSSNSTILTRSQLDAKNSDTGDGSMPPPSINKIKKKFPHSGVYCTPNKHIPCHVCKLSFNNILAYTEHSLSHSSAVNGEAAVYTSSESTQTQVELKTDSTQTSQEDSVAASN